MRSVVLIAALAVSACATALPQIVERDGDVFDVRYDASAQSQTEVDAAADAHCANGAVGYVSQQTGFDGFAYRTYRCARR